MAKFFDDLEEGLKEAVAYENKKQTLRSHHVELPSEPMQYTSKDIKRLRASGNYSQAFFAAVLNVSVKTVQSWESGERSPSHAALRLLEIIDKGLYRPSSSTHAA
jgi:putative transcriptional regulator